MRQGRGGDTNPPAGLGKIVTEPFVTTDEIHHHLAFEVDQIVGLTFDGGVDVVLVGPGGVQLPAQKAREILMPAQVVRALPADMMEGTDLQVPGIADEGKLEELIEKLLR